MFEVAQGECFTEDAVLKTDSLQMGISGSPQTAVHTVLAHGVIGEVKEALRKAVR